MTVYELVEKVKVYIALSLWIVLRKELLDETVLLTYIKLLFTSLHKFFHFRIAKYQN